ncbi:hypothetical protein [Pseudoalteromonas luteoviolacea]|uniref:hypothetical protein n=1 Tax=Pseudoalteromonas luteoviolacea TaxID=43657 RepID=UPI000A745A7E|nr:hypothetical protein [Pseudoalteromonas luteoviolacea]
MKNPLAQYTVTYTPDRTEVAKLRGIIKEYGRVSYIDLDKMLDNISAKNVCLLSAQSEKVLQGLPWSQQLHQILLHPTKYLTFLNLDFDSVKSESEVLFKQITTNINAYPVHNTDYEIITEGVHIPVVCEATRGEGKALIFNELSSCLGLVGLSADKTHLRGAHFFMDFENPNQLAAIVNQELTNYFHGYSVNSFGGFQNEWKDSFNIDAPAALKGDANSKKWFFYINKLGDLDYKLF